MDAADCGLACLMMVFAAHGIQAQAAEVRELVGLGRSGASARALLTAARAKGLSGKGLAVTASAASELAPTAILSWHPHHFVVLRRITADRVEVIDPAYGARRVSADQFRSEFAGVALDFGAPPGRSWRRRSRATWAMIRRRADRLDLRRSAVLAYLALSALVAASWIGISWLVATFTDDRSALSGGVGAAIAALPVAVLLLAYVARDRLYGRFAARAEQAFGSTLARHVLSLPAGFFIGRGSSDLAMRVRTATTLRQIARAPVVTAPTDALSALVAMLAAAVQWRLAAVAAACLAGQIAVGVLAVRWRRESADRELSAQAAANVNLMRVLGGVLEVQAAGAAAEAIERMTAPGAPPASRRRFATAQRMVDVSAVLTPAALLAAGAVWARAGAVSPGVVAGLTVLAVWATMAARSAIAAAVAMIPDVRVLFERAEQLLDLAPGAWERSALEDRCAAVVRLRGVVPLPGRPAVDAEFHPGQLVAVTGGPHTGKTALALALVGLSPPAGGQIEVAEEYARRTGWVPQEPFLFAGRIRANIALLAPDASDAQIERAARAAGLDVAVAGLPLAYQTLLGAGGEGLTTSMRRRIALARSLLRDPRLLVIDEGLDEIEDPVAVCEALRSLAPVVVIATRRDECVKAADAVIDLGQAARP